MSEILELNADMGQFVRVNTQEMEWTASPSGTVKRKRLHLYGPAESGQVTSVVRYMPESNFPEHGHPEGEEIYVLEGVFSDQAGHWPAGSYLLNPESFRHAPFSKEGCVILVKLRQYPGAKRTHISRDTNTLEWEKTEVDGLTCKWLYREMGQPETMRLVHMQAGARPGPITYAGGAEIFVVSGAFSDEKGTHGAGTWLRYPAGAAHIPVIDEDTVVYVKEGHLPFLRAPK